jgi:hypothetical protein
MTNIVRLQLSAGLFAVAVVHAIVMSVILSVNFAPPTGEQADRLPLRPAAPDTGRPTGEYRGEDSYQLPPVDQSALNEMKHAGGAELKEQCPTCPTPQVTTPQTTNDEPRTTNHERTRAHNLANFYGATVVVQRYGDGTVTCYAYLAEGLHWRATDNRATKRYRGEDCFSRLITAMRQGVRDPSLSPDDATTPLDDSDSDTMTPSTGVNDSLPKSGRYQIALFLGEDAKSRRLAEWFETDAQLKALAAKLDFQRYTADNALYRSRYRREVPEQHFPAILFLRPDGGHIHAAAKSMIPATASELYSDLKRSYGLAKQVESAESGAIRERGYSWDEAITPNMQLDPEDCPDGICPPGTSQTQPRRPIVDRLFDRVKDEKEGLFAAWISLTEIIAICFFAVILIGMVLVIVKFRV